MSGQYYGGDYYGDETACDPLYQDCPGESTYTEQLIDDVTDTVFSVETFEMGRWHLFYPVAPALGLTAGLINLFEWKGNSDWQLTYIVELASSIASLGIFTLGALVKDSDLVAQIWYLDMPINCILHLVSIFQIEKSDQDSPASGWTTKGTIALHSVAAAASGFISWSNLQMNKVESEGDADRTTEDF